MAPVFDVLRTCGLIVSLVFFVSANQNTASGPWIVSVEVETMSCVQNICKYLLNVRGGEFLGHSSWRLSPKEGSKGGSCEEWLPKFETVVIETLKWSTKIRASIPSTENKIYFCLRPYGGEWVHQGADVYLDPLGPVGLAAQRSTSNTREKQKNNLLEAETKWADLSHDTDVNQLPNIARPTRNEAKDIEILVNDKYVPLLELDSRNVQKHRNDNSINKFNNVRNDYNGNRNNINSRNNNNNNNDAINNYNLDERDVQESVNLLSNNENHNELQQNKHLIFNNKVARKKRYSNDTDDLFSVKDIFDAKVNLENSIKPKQPTEYYEDALIRIRKTRQTEPDVPKIDGLRVEHAEKEPEITEEFIPSVLAGTSVVLRLFGDGLTNTTVIAFTSEPQDFGSVCKYLLKGEFMVKKDSVQPRSAVFEVTAPDIPGKSKLFICTKNVKGEVSDPFKDDDKFIHQGVESYKIVAVHTKLLPLWISLALILTCLMFSALFSGLNLGLMSLDRTELKIISNTGTESERLYAKSIMPVRDHGNYLLCSILLGNVAVNSTFTIMLDSLTSGLFAVIFSTLLIVLFGEITPQAICCRHGLAIGAKTIFITKTVMMITAPLSYPVSKLLDYFLGEEIGNVYNRERLKELVKVTTDVNDLDKDEVNIISGALEMRKKTVSDVMTKLEDVFMLPITSVLDFETMSEIVKSGFSRIPVYEGDRGNIVTVLFIKDLAFVDPDDNTPLRTLCQYYQNPCNFVFEDVTLDVMFKQFKEGNKGHMAFVHRINNEGEGDPFYETIGLVTLEDVIEEMIQAEIVDETDVFMDNRTKRRRKGPQHKLQDFAAFAERHENQQCHISPQLTLATFQFLSTSVDAFRPDVVSETVLRRLLRQNVIYHIKLKGKARTDPSTYVFQQGKAVDYFVLILEGRVEVTVGRENLVFEAGPFTYFGVQALTQNVGVPESPTPSAKGSLQNLNMDSMLHHTFVPDYSVRAVTDVYYLIVKRSLYLAAKRATLMEKGALSKGATNEQFDTVVDKPPQSTTDSDQNITLSEALMKSTHRPFTTSSCSDEQDAGTSRAAAKNVDIVDPKRSAPLITIRDINDDDDILSIYESSLSINPKNLKARTSTYIDPDLIVPPETDVRNTKYEPKDRRTSLGESKSATGKRVLIKGSKLDQERERIEKRSALFEERKYKSKDSKDASKTQREYFIKRVVSTINLPKFSSDTVVEESGVERSEDILAAKDYDETKDMGELIKSKSASEMKKSIIKRDYIPIEQRKSISIRDDVSLIEHSMSDENASKKSERSKLNSLLNFLKRSSSKIDDQNQTQPTTTTTNTQPTTEKDSKQSLIDEHWPSEIDRSDERAKTKDDVTGSDENMKASRDAMKKSSDSKKITDDKSVSEKDKSLDSECVLKSDDLTITRSSNDEGDSTATRTGESSSKWSTSKSSISQVSRTQEDEISRQRFRNANITEKDNGEIRDVKLTERTAPNLKFLEDEKENADRKPTSVRERGKNKKPDTLSHESLVREDDDNRRLEVNEEILRKLTKILNILEKKDHT